MSSVGAKIDTEALLRSRVTLRLSETASLLSLPRSTFYGMVMRREIDSIRIGNGQRKTILISTRAIREFLAKNTVPARKSRGRR